MVVARIQFTPGGSLVEVLRIIAPYGGVTTWKRYFLQKRERRVFVFFSQTTDGSTSHMAFPQYFPDCLRTENPVSRTGL